MALRPHFRIQQRQLGLHATRPICVQFLHSKRSVPPHDHDYDEISVVLGGNAIHRTDAGHDRISAGAVIAIAPGQTHAFEIDTRCEFLNIYYLSEWLADDLREAFDADGLLALFASRQLRRRPPSLIRRAGLLDQGEQLAVRSDESDLSLELSREQPSRLFLKASFIKLLIRLNRAFRRTSPEDFQPDLHPDVRRLMEQIEEELTGLPVGTAKTSPSSLSKGHIARLFKRDVGYSPTEYFQRRRTLLAANLLLETTLSIGDVAQRTGFSDSAHLARIFKREKGLSPRAFRNAYAGAH